MLFVYYLYKILIYYLQSTYLFYQKECALAEYPGVYARVSVFADWIRTKLGANYVPSEDDEINMDIVKVFPGAR